MQYDEKSIHQFLEDNFGIWNAGDRDAFTELYRNASANGLEIEYVGQDPVDGWAAFNHMWDTYNTEIHAEPQQILVNGNEGAVYVHNIVKKDGAVHPSIEIYRFVDGKLHIRYFHNTEALAD
jgi:hypothetical protein